MPYDNSAEVAAQVAYVVQIRPAGNQIQPDGWVVDERDRGRHSMLWAISGRLIMPPEKRCFM
jgi:hypothetical protein